MLAHESSVLLFGDHSQRPDLPQTADESNNRHWKVLIVATQALVRLPKLERLSLTTLDLGKPEYEESLEFVRSAKRLKELIIGPKKGLRDCGVLESCKGLETLVLMRGVGFDFSVLPNVLSLRSLKVEMAKDEAIGHIGEIRQLTSLELRGGFNLRSLVPFKKLTELVNLRLWSGFLVSCEGAASLSGMQELDLGYSNVSDPTDLRGATGLKRLELIGNKKITRLDFLPPNLEYLGLFEIPSIESLEPIRKLQLLRELRISGKVQDGNVTVLVGLPRLEKAIVPKSFRPGLNEIRSECGCVFEVGRETLKLTHAGLVVLESEAEAKRRLMRKLMKR